jgi:hypothetical protein
MAAADLTAEVLRQLLNYDPETGAFTRRARTSNKVRVGDKTGTLRRDGYLKTSLLHQSFLLHRLAWLYVYGKWPEFVIDHVNGDRTDNRIANLRDVSETSNLQNQRRAHSKNRSCGLLGVTWHAGNGRWQAQISVNKRNMYLGSFDTAEDAHAAYLQAKRQLHEGCTI